MLDKLADNLELNEFINENLERHEIDGFREKIKELVEKIFEEINGNINGQNPTKKGKFLKALIRTFSILFNANISSAKKTKKIIKESARLVLNLWPGQSSLLEEPSTTTTTETPLLNQDEETKESPDKETDTSN